MGEHSALFLAARPPQSEVAVVYNPLAHFVGGRQRADRLRRAPGRGGRIERDSLLGIYRALFPTNVPLDFVHADQLKASALAPYKLVVLPYPLMMPAAAATELREYVRAGGALVAEARAGGTTSGAAPRTRSPASAWPRSSARARRTCRRWRRARRRSCRRGAAGA